MNGFSTSGSTMRTIVLLLSLVFTGGSLTAQEWEPQIPADAGTHPTGDILIRNLDAVWTSGPEGVLRNVSILIRDGVIQEIGQGLDAPSGVEVVDGSGMTAIPGLVDEHSHTAMAATNEGTAPIVPEVRVLDALRTDDFSIYRALSGGVTTARIMHGSANPIGGQSAVIKMRWGMDETDQLLLPGAPRFVKFALGENVTRKGRNRPPVRFPMSRQGVEAVYVEAFTAAQRYRDEWSRYRENPDAFRVPPRRDLRLEALVDIMEGRVRIHAHSYRSDEILMLMRVAERFGFKIDVFTHVLEGYKVASEMAEHGAAGSTFSDWWQYKLEAYDAIPFNAAVMHEHGVKTAINSDIPFLQAFMHYEYVKPVKYGDVSREDALKMLTLYPAQMMYIDDKVGSLEEGKQGDVVIMSGDPFSSFTRVEKTVVDGIVYYDLSREEETRGEPFNELPDPGRAGTPVAADPAGMGGGETGDARTSMDEDGSDENGDMDQMGTTALVGGTVHPVSGPSISDGVVVISGGRIQAVGARGSVEVPADARRVDVSGKHVYPGMIDPITTLGIFEFGQSPKATDTDEEGRYLPHVRAVSAVHPHGAAMNVARANGITTALVAQGSGVVTGTAGVIQLKGDTWERATVEAEAVLTVDFPAPRSSSEDRRWTDFATVSEIHAPMAGAARGAGAAWSGDGEPAGSGASVRAPGPVQSDDEGPEPDLEGERMEELVELFRRARSYAEGQDLREEPTDPFWPNRWGGDKVVLEAMLPVMRGERPVFFDADTEWQIRTLFKFLDEFPEVRGVVVGGTQAYKVADELARRDVPVIVTSALSPTPDRDESITASYRNAAILHQAGVKFAFGTDDSSNNRNLPYHAAHSVAFGLPHEAGLRAITLSTAEILGMGDEMGSLDEGKRADVIVADGDIMEIVTRVERMWIHGEEVDPRDNKHYRLYQEFKDRR